MRCAVCAAAKVQNFSSRATVVTSPPVRLRSAARSRPDSTAIPCAAVKRWSATASSCAKNRRSSAFTLFSKGSFATTSRSAARQKGITGENLLFLLERRLDNAIYRAGFSTSRRQARQLVNHGHVEVNGRKVDIPSFQVKAGDVVSVKEASRKNPHVEGAWQTAAGRGRPSWIAPAEART